MMIDEFSLTLVLDQFGLRPKPRPNMTWLRPKFGLRLRPNF